MSTLRFSLDFKSQDLSSVELPVKVRRPNLTLAAEGLTSESVELKPGTYYVTARMPGGQELTQEITLEPEADATVLLRPEAEDESPFEAQEVQHFLTVKHVSVNLGTNLESLGPASEKVRLRAFGGNLLSGEARALDTIKINAQPLKDAVRFDLFGVEGVRLVQLLFYGAPGVNVAFPADSAEKCFLFLSKDSSEQWSIDSHLKNTKADLLVRYLEKGLLRSATLASDPTTRNAESLLLQKEADPIAAAVGAYVILRAGELDQLHTWTEKLKNWFPWLPDGLAIRGEHLARLGEHESAFEAFLELPSRGLPFFSDGLSYALERLRVYTNPKSAFFESRRSQATEVLERLEKFARFADFRKPILTFTGADPNEPDNEVVRRMFDSYGGQDISTYLP